MSIYSFTKLVLTVLQYQFLQFYSISSCSYMVSLLTALQYVLPYNIYAYTLQYQHLQSTYISRFHNALTKRHLNCKTGGWFLSMKWIKIFAVFAGSPQHCKKIPIKWQLWIHNAGDISHQIKTVVQDENVIWSFVCPKSLLLHKYWILT